MAVIVVALLVVWANNNQQNQYGHVLPTPDAARTTFTNAVYSYSIRYPKQWKLTVTDDKSMIRAFIVFNKGDPEAIAFEVDCSYNPANLDAEQWWQQTAAFVNNQEKGEGSIKLKSGVTAYKATGQAQLSYTVYTMVKSGIACQVVAYEADPSNSQITTDSVNSFMWL